MVKQLLVALVITFFLMQMVQAQTLGVIQQDITYLASDALEGRETGQKGEKMAAAYLVQRFKGIGLEPKGTGGSYEQVFTFEHFSDKSHSSDTVTGTNIIGYLDNQAKNTILIGAHYDHIGYGKFASKAPGKLAIHNGADDNASGVAAMLYLAEQLTKASLKNNNYLFVAFSGEEMGLFGSQHFIKNPTIDLGQIHVMINLNRVGRLNENRDLSILGTGTSMAWKETIPRIEAGELNVKQVYSGIGDSDQNSFYMAKIAALHLTTGMHDDYHTPKDDSDKINFEGIVAIGDYLFRLMKELDRLGRIPFAPTMNTNPNENAPKYKVTLGVRPNYNAAKGGVLIG